ncbi:hypothetical protein [Streptomyces sp. NPDC096013]|uniref:hypothetical protein n=1 Tax=Streptomyces sp. NPDC096013 TaxID=3366069 RepID=UPI00382F7B69
MSNDREDGRHYTDADTKVVAESEGTPVVNEPNRLESWAWYPLNSLPSPQFLRVELTLNSYRSGKLHIP